MLSKHQVWDSPEGTAVNISPAHNRVNWLSTDEYVDILDSVHLAGILQNKHVWPRIRYRQAEVQLRLEETEHLFKGDIQAF